MATDVTTTCRDIDELKPLARKAIILFFQECFKAGVHIFVTETFRSQARQNYLYAQGRTRKGSIVTWTTSSRHTSAMAWDIGAATVNGNTNIYNATVLNKAGAIARKLGITWGGDWKNNIDRPHFEISSSWVMPKGYTINGTVSIPTRSSQMVKIVSAVNKLPKVEVKVTEEKLEEEIKVKNYIPTINDSTTPTLKTAFADKVRKAYDSGVIKSKHWVEGAESGSINIVDAALLNSFIDRPETLADLNNNTLRNTIIEEIKAGFEEGHITNENWVTRAENGTLEVTNAFALILRIAQLRKK